MMVITKTESPEVFDMSSLHLCHDDLGLLYAMSFQDVDKHGSQQLTILYSSE